MSALTPKVAVLLKRVNLLVSPLRLSRAGLFTLILTSILFTLPTEATASMFGFFKKKYDIHLSPEVHGSIKLNGKPMAGLLVSRELAYIRDYEKTEIAITDEQGQFSFPERSTQSTKPDSMFHEPSLLNVVKVTYEDKEYQLWWDISSSIEPAKGKSEKLLQLNCDLKDSLEDIEFENIEDPRWPHLIASICRW